MFAEVGEGSHLLGRGQEGGERPTDWWIGTSASTQVFHHTTRACLWLAREEKRRLTLESLHW